jgi:glycerol kinase
MDVILAIDQSTSATKALLYDIAGRLIDKSSLEHRQIYPRPGWVEHDPDAIWGSVCEALARAMEEARIAPREIAAVGITNQRETAVLWDRKTGAPARTAIVWQDRRTAGMCEELKRAGKEPRLRELTGLVLDPYFSATKVRWMLEEDRALAAKAESGALAFGTVDSFLVWRLTGGAAHVTDPSNASRTLLFGLRSLAWEDELLQLFGVPRACLPEVRASAEVYGETRGVPGLPDGIPVAGIAGDQQAALFGQACFAPGDAKCTYGTGSFILMNTGDRPVPSESGLVSTVAWKLGAGDEQGEVAYALEGSAFIAGAAVQWLRDGLGLIRSAAEVEELARSVEDSGGVVMVPAFTGLGAPHWRPDARGVITGITRGTTKAHLARAALEGIAFQQHDILEVMQRDSGRPLSSLKVDGGAAANDLLMQFQADLLDVTISRPAILETTALGAAFLAGLGAGIWRSKTEIARTWREERRFAPTGDRARVAEHVARWKVAVGKA